MHTFLLDHRLQISRPDLWKYQGRAARDLVVIGKQDLHFELAHLRRFCSLCVCQLRIVLCVPRNGGITARQQLTSMKPIRHEFRCPPFLASSSLAPNPHLAAFRSSS